MKLRSLVVMSMLVFGACSGTTPGSPERTPDWLTLLIRDLETQPVARPAAFIARYDYNGQVVYYLPPRCCDIWSNLYGSDGALLCHPDGGLTGRGDDRCPDFLSQRRNELIVWRDSRSSG